jgi:site-specific DNA recombinase
MNKRTKQGNPKIAVAYLRVSTDEQRLGPEAQREAIERWASRTGVQIAAWYTDQGVSGGAELSDRPGLQSAVDALEEHGSGILVVAKRDRPARDVVLAALIERLTENKGAKVISAAGEGGDENDPSSMLMRRIVDAFSEYERALIRSRTKAALAVKKAKGERTGTVRFGFRLASDGRSLERDSGEQGAIARTHELRASGVSIRGIVAKLAEEGVVGRTGKPLCKATIEAVLCNAAA